MEYNLKLSPAHADVILRALGTLPWQDANATMQVVMAQIQAHARGGAEVAEAPQQVAADQ